MLYSSESQFVGLCILSWRVIKVVHVDSTEEVFQVLSSKLAFLQNRLSYPLDDQLPELHSILPSIVAEFHLELQEQEYSQEKGIFFNLVDSREDYMQERHNFCRRLSDDEV